MATQSILTEKTTGRIKKPGRYKVIMYNDDFTPMDFVVEILMTVFNRQEAEAVEMMYTVHEKGSAAVGIYPLDIAKTKVRKATELARQSGYPFRLETEEV